MPMTNSVVVDQVSALDLIDQLRVAVPEELHAAKRINSEGPPILDSLPGLKAIPPMEVQEALHAAV